MFLKSATLTRSPAPALPFIDEMPMCRYATSSEYRYAALTRFFRPSAAFFDSVAMLVVATLVPYCLRAMRRLGLLPAQGRRSRSRRPPPARGSTSHAVDR